MHGAELLMSKRKLKALLVEEKAAELELTHHEIHRAKSEVEEQRGEAQQQQDYTDRLKAEL